jgi:hypothetical protein
VLKYCETDKATIFEKIRHFYQFSSRVLVGKVEGRNHLEKPDVDGRIILKWMLEKLDGGHRA